ncbi:hypothetical protein DVH24_005296 [Malus domestica]|uniref:Uncharacterized protein n=1 Tax=Malus domestica TaxID=3750 RepID=A0A498KR18_MALDO|nr:hypothetical protein DVH24_005296 [Malus domestica]
MNKDLDSRWEPESESESDFCSDLPHFSVPIGFSLRSPLSFDRGVCIGSNSYPFRPVDGMLSLHGHGMHKTKHVGFVGWHLMVVVPIVNSLGIRWVNWYLVGKFVKKDLYASTLFDEIAKRQSEDAAGNLFDRMTLFFS